MDNKNPPLSAPPAMAVPGERSDPPPAEAALREAVGRMARASLMVAGDALLDRIMLGTVRRLSPEAPVPLLDIRRESAAPAGAGGVVRHLAALGAAAALVAPVGEDAAGRELTAQVGALPGIEPWLLADSERRTVEKIRFIADVGPYGTPLLRADRNEARPLAGHEAARLVRIAIEAMAATSVVVLADHRRGTLAGNVAPRLIAAARERKRPVVVDLRGHDYARFAGADVVLTTRRQIAHTLPAPEVPPGEPPDEPAYAAAAEALRRAHGFGAVLVTDTEAGITLVRAGGWQHYPVDAPEAPELVGAADAVTAVLSAALAVGVDLPGATRLANIAAGIMLRRSVDSVVRGADLVAALSPQAHARRKVVAAASLAERGERWHRQGLRIGLALGCFDPLQPAERALLARARAGCDRLAVLVFDDAAAQRRLGPDHPTEPEAVRAERVAELDAVGRVVISAEQDVPAVLALLRPALLAGLAPARDADLLRGFSGELLAPDA